MGFNTWNHYALNINETVIKQTADAFVDLGLDKLGYRYINIDDGWAHKERAKDGHVIVNRTKFPRGIKHVSDYVHSKGLKFGIYSDGGTHTCGGQAGSLWHEQIDAQDYSDWGVDYLKYDNCNNEGIHSIMRYSTMAAALMQTERDIFFSMCNWGEDDVTDWSYHLGAGSWRTTGDVSDEWARMLYVIDLNTKMFNPEGYGPTKGWNDVDMLEVGNGGMSVEEYEFHFSLWCMLKSPLLIGNNVVRMNKTDEAYRILTNEGAISVNQDPLGVQGNCVTNCLDYEALQVWTGPLLNDGYAVGVFNFSGEDVKLDSLCWEDILLPYESYSVWDIWAKKKRGVHTSCYARKTTIKSHGVLFLRLERVYFSPDL